ncbi:hypothetical protein UFOVP531_20 [uncultured Caudovirales phage]|uniref:Uncharacterized protein n=1 Tax=uncultured Caudovirales phage TaxID=2100421 RepID=A0A6J5MUW4_9CAUD|nr:hypothetical protein UFOVP531_20 [uncultured Caudovirales phage]
MNLKTVDKNFEEIKEGFYLNGYVDGAKAQAKIMHNDEEVMTILYCFHYDLVNSNIDTKEEWFEQFKKQIIK